MALTELPSVPEDRCPSLRRTILHAEGGKEVYLRCQGKVDHVSPKHRNWMRKWDTSEEDGRIS